jgi:flagellar hook assembly protein FlgD
VIIPLSALSNGECYSIGYGGSVIYDTLKVERLLNYPNPVADKGTYFVFGLTKPASVKIKIYTLSGILVKTLYHNGVAGYNEVYWDGLDDNDNRLGNGVYIYKLIADDGNERTTEVGRLAILR